MNFRQEASLVSNMEEVICYYNRIFQFIQTEIPRQKALIPELSNKEIADEFVRQLIQTDLFYLCYYVLGYKDLDYLHWEICQESYYERADELWQLPREHLKSTILTIARTIQRILKDRNKTHLICNAVIENSKQFLYEIKQHMEGNDALHELYPWTKQRTKWDETRITLPRDVVVKEPTITVAGVGQSFASRHYDYIVFDDLLNERNTESNIQVDKVIKWFKQVYPLLKDGGKRSVIGTRWTYGDLYEYIEREYEDFFVYKRKIKEEGRFIYPRRFDQARHDKLKRNMKGFLFSCQYYNEPIAEGDQLFRPEHFIHLKKEEIDKVVSLQKFIMVDPASSKKTTADYTAIIVFGIDKLRNRYIIDCIRDKYDPQEQIDVIFEWVKKHDVGIVGIESFGFQGYLKFNIEQEMLRRQRDSTLDNPSSYFQVIELKPKGRAKEDRISSLQPMFVNKRFFFAEKAVHESNYDHQLRDYIDVLKIELLQFPKSEHDDLSDCLAYTADLDPFLHAKYESTQKTFEEFKKKDVFDSDYEIWEDALHIQYRGNSPYIAAIEDEEKENVNPITYY